MKCRLVSNATEKVRPLSVQGPVENLEREFSSFRTRCIHVFSDYRSEVFYLASYPDLRHIDWEREPRMASFQGG